MSKRINVTDNNGKQFEVDFRDITDMTTDLEGSSDGFRLEDADKFKMDSYKVTIVDSLGNTVDVNAILDEAKSNPASLPKAIDVEFEATHSGQNRNFFIYHSDSMENDAQSWKSPFPKPFLKNHDSYSEPLGRVLDFHYSQSDFNPDRDCINVTYRITDEDAINKFLDGRYKTMSIGGSVGQVSCGICGKDIVKDGQFKFCGHWKGETYNGQKAFWNGRNIDYKEGSVVNMPADDWAQVKRITVVTNTTAAKDGETMDTPVVTDKESNILDDIDGLINNTDIPVTDNDKANDEPVVTDGEKDTDPIIADETIETIKAERDTLKDEISTIKVDKLALDNKVQDLEKQIATLNDSITSLSEERNINANEAKDSRQQSIKLAVMNKKLMAERVIDFEAANGQVADDKKADRLSELISKSARELTDMVDTMSNAANTARRTIADKVANPSVINTGNEPNVVVDDNSDNIPTPAKARYTMKDLEDSLISAMTR